MKRLSIILILLFSLIPTASKADYVYHDGKVMKWFLVIGIEAIHECGRMPDIHFLNTYKTEKQCLAEQKKHPNTNWTCIREDVLMKDCITNLGVSAN